MREVEETKRLAKLTLLRAAIEKDSIKETLDASN